MATIHGLEAVKAKLGNQLVTTNTTTSGLSYTFRGYSLVKELRYVQQRDGNRLIVVLQLNDTDETPQSQPYLKLELKGVSDLAITEFGGPITQLPSLAIDDISERGWENISWELNDYEENSFHCFAREIEMTTVSQAEYD